MRTACVMLCSTLTLFEVHVYCKVFLTATVYCTQLYVLFLYEKATFAEVLYMYMYMCMYVHVLTLSLNSSISLQVLIFSVLATLDQQIMCVLLSKIEY